MEKEAFAIGWMENDDTRNLKSLFNVFIRKCTNLLEYSICPQEVVVTSLTFYVNYYEYMEIKTCFSL